MLYYQFTYWEGPLLLLSCVGQKEMWCCKHLCVNFHIYIASTILGDSNKETHWTIHKSIFGCRIYQLLSIWLQYFEFSPVINEKSCWHPHCIWCCLCYEFWSSLLSVRCYLFFVVLIWIFLMAAYMGDKFSCFYLPSVHSFWDSIQAFGSTFNCYLYSY